MNLKWKLIICLAIGFVGSWFVYTEYVKGYKSDGRQVENKQVIMRKVDKPTKIIIQKNGRWYAGSELDVLKNQK